MRTRRTRPVRESSTSARRSGHAHRLQPTQDVPLAAIDDSVSDSHAAVLRACPRARVSLVGNTARFRDPCFGETRICYGHAPR